MGSNNVFITETGANASSLANDPNFQRKFARIRIGPSGIGSIGGPPSRIFPDPILIKGTYIKSQEVIIVGTKNDEEIEKLQNEEKNLQAKRDEAVKKESVEEAERTRQQVLTEEAERTRQQALAALQSQNQDLFLRLQQLIAYRDVASNRKATLEQFINSLRRQQDGQKEEISTLQDQLSNFKETKIAYQEDLNRLQEREGKLVELINNIANDKQIEMELNSLGREITSFSGIIDDIQDLLFKVVSLRKKSQKALEKASVIVIKDSFLVKKIETFAFEKLAELLNTDFRASDIADWVTGLSQAIAEAKLSNAEQKATAVQQLGDQLKSTRVSIRKHLRIDSSKISQHFANQS